MLLPISEMLTTLADQRRIFHSEADFQHALAWEIHERFPDSSIRLERPVLFPKRVYVDVWIERDGRIFVMELKYRQRALTTTWAGEQFKLRNQGAQDIGRYAFIKDIQRVEDIVGDQDDVSGYAILLTNDPTYWSQKEAAPKALTIDAAFRLNEGRVLHGSLEWGAGASEGTKRGYEEVLNLRGTYPYGGTPTQSYRMLALRHVPLPLGRSEQRRLMSTIYCMSKKVDATLIVIGEAHRLPQPGERVLLHVADGSWQGGFRCISDVLEEDGERVVWVTREEEYQHALRKGQTPAGDTWPVSQMAATDG